MEERLKLDPDSSKKVQFGKKQTTTSEEDDEVFVVETEHIIEKNKKKNLDVRRRISVSSFKHEEFLNKLDTRLDKDNNMLAIPNIDPTMI